MSEHESGQHEKSRRKLREGKYVPIRAFEKKSYNLWQLKIAQLFIKYYENVCNLSEAIEIPK